MDLPVKKSTSSIIAILFIFLLLLAFTAFMTPFLLYINGLTKLNGSVFFINRLLIWVILILLWLYCKYAAHQKLLTWPETRRSIPFYLLSVIVILIVLLIGNIIIARILALFVHNTVSQKFLEYVAIFKTNILLMIFTAFTAAVTEELIFRGFIQARLSDILKSPVAGILISSLLFASVHLSYGTWGNFIIPLFIGVVFSFFYWKYRNIKILIICHFLWDVLALLISVKTHG